MRIAEAILLLCMVPSLIIGLGAMADRAIAQQDIICQEGC